MNNVINVWQDILISMQTTPMAALSAGAMAYLIPVLVGTSTGKNMVHLALEIGWGRGCPLLLF